MSYRSHPLGLLLRGASFSPVGAAPPKAKPASSGSYDNVPPQGSCGANQHPLTDGTCVCNDGFEWNADAQECALISSGTYGGGSGNRTGGSTPVGPGGALKLSDTSVLAPLVIAAAFLGTVAFVLAETAPKPHRVRSSR